MSVPNHVVVCAVLRSKRRLQLRDPLFTLSGQDSKPERQCRRECSGRRSARPEIESGWRHSAVCACLGQVCFAWPGWRVQRGSSQDSSESDRNAETFIAQSVTCRRILWTRHCNVKTAVLKLVQRSDTEAAAGLCFGRLSPPVAW